MCTHVAHFDVYIYHTVTHTHTHIGALLVDATRRGRKLPDSFAKTVPIWCACINRAIAANRRDHIGSPERGGGGEGGGDGWCSELRTPPCVDTGERAEIEARLDAFVSVLLACATCTEVLPALRIYTHIHTCIYIHLHTHIYVCIYIHTYINTFIHLHTYTYIRMCIHTCTHVHTYIYLCVYKHTHTHTHTHIHTHTHTHKTHTHNV
jgi:hypothetical protein